MSVPEYCSVSLSKHSRTDIFDKVFSLMICCFTAVLVSVHSLKDSEPLVSSRCHLWLCWVTENKKQLLVSCLVREKSRERPQVHYVGMMAVLGGGE